MKRFLAPLLLCLAVANAGWAQTLNGAGATFPYPIYSKWFNEYHKLHHGNVQINYQSIGSGGGIRQLTAGTVDFGASDGPMSDQQLAGGEVQDLPHPDGAGRGGARLQRAGREPGAEVQPGASSPTFSC